MIEPSSSSREGTALLLAEFQNFNLSIGSANILNLLNMTLEPGKIYSIIGRNGAGKTQILKALAGLLDPKMETQGLLRPPSSVGFVFQSPALFPWMTVLENLLLVAPLSEAKARDYLTQFNISQYASSFPFALSGGTQQKVNIIRAFLVETPLVVMDEPFVSLDLPQKNELLEMIVKLWNNEKTVLFVTHDIDEALMLSQKIFYLSKKRKNITKEWNLEEALPRDFNEVRGAAWAQEIYFEAKSLLESEHDVEV